MALWTLGILSPLVLIPAQLFNGPDHAPSLLGQYVIKDIVLLTATLVIATAALRRDRPVVSMEYAREKERL